MGNKKDLGYFLKDKETTGKWSKKVTDTPRPSVAQILKAILSGEGK